MTKLYVGDAAAGAEAGEEAGEEAVEEAGGTDLKTRAPHNFVGKKNLD